MSGSSRNLSIRKFSDKNTQDFLKGILRINDSVPIIGSGFTAGEQARRGIVPNGKQWMSIMVSQIVKVTDKERPDEEELKNLNFQDLSDIYFRENIVPLEIIKSTIDDLFTFVDISSEASKAFLSCDWPYIYTLNIDDAIERYIDVIKVLPYREFLRFKDRRYVYKLHGDAEDALSAPNRDRLQVIFGRADYIKSLNKNEPLISKLTNDFVEKNIIFIGCSLTDEIDISYALAGAENSRGSGAARVFVTSSEHLDFITKMKLKGYGVTDVVVVDDYPNFYSFVSDSIHAEAAQHSVLEEFKFDDSQLEYSKKQQLRYLTQNKWDKNTNPVIFTIQRDLEVKLKNEIGSPIIAIWGRRFSGKTTLLYNLLSSDRSKERFLVKTTSKLTDTSFNQLLNKKNSIIGIDTHAVNSAQIRLLLSKSDSIKENNTTILLALGKNEWNLVSNELVPFEISSKFSISEVAKINAKIASLGLPAWDYRSILDNIFSIGDSAIYATEVGEALTLSVQVNNACGRGENSKIAEFDFICLYYLAIFERCYSKTLRTILKKFGVTYLNDSYIDELPKKWAPLVENDITDTETHRVTSSRKVLVGNSFAWIQHALRVLSNKLGKEKSAELISRLYESIRNEEENAHELILFDSLNSIYESSRTGHDDVGARIILSVYEKLSTSRSGEPDYWIQRAKAFYYLSTKEAELRTAIEYCSKVLDPRMQPTDRNIINAKLTKANLLGKLCMVTKYEQDSDLILAVSVYADVIGERESNPSYVDRLLKKSKDGRSYLSQLYKAASTRPALLTKRINLQYIDEYLQAR